MESAEIFDLERAQEVCQGFQFKIPEITDVDCHTKGLTICMPYWSAQAIDVVEYRILASISSRFDL